MAKRPSKKAPAQKASARKASARKTAARKTSTGKTAAGGAAGADQRRHIIDTTFVLVLERGWRDLSLADIAEAAGLPLSKLYPIFGSKQAILEGFTDGRSEEQTSELQSLMRISYAVFCLKKQTYDAKQDQQMYTET